MVAYDPMAHVRWRISLLNGSTTSSLMRNTYRFLNIPLEEIFKWRLQYVVPWFQHYAGFRTVLCCHKKGSPILSVCLLRYYIYIAVLLHTYIMKWIQFIAVPTIFVATTSPVCEGRGYKATKALPFAFKTVAEVFTPTSMDVPSIGSNFGLPS